MREHWTHAPQSGRVVAMPAGDPWTDDDPRLLELFEDGYSDAAIAKRLGRSPGSIRMRKIKLGLAVPQSRWTAEERERLRELVAAGFTSARIAAKLGRSEASVRRVRARLRVSG
jgi:DNA-binding NarL/FixJ family response regulator